jgi:hypothetical protein
MSDEFDWHFSDPDDAKAEIPWTMTCLVAEHDRNQRQ